MIDVVKLRDRIIKESDQMDKEVEDIIQKLPKLQQRQYDTSKQLGYLSKIAVKLGLYDADDIIRKSIKA